MKFAWVILGLCILATGLPGEPLRIATFNLYNYLAMDRVVDGRWRPEYPKPESEKAAIRRLLRRVNPDVLLLQEIGSRGDFRELLRDLRLAGVKDYRGYFCALPDSSRNLALISREEVIQFRCHDGLTFSYSREIVQPSRALLEAEFETEGVRWHLFGVHLKSRYSEHEEDPQSRRFRVGEWRAISAYFQKRRAEGELGPFCVLGDFNEDLESVSRLGEEISRAWPRLYQVPARDSRGNTYTYTYFRTGDRDLVDALFASREWLAGIENVGSILGTHEVKASDHRLVYWDWDPLFEYGKKDPRIIP